MKKIIAILLALILVMLSGCNAIDTSLFDIADEKVKLTLEYQKNGDSESAFELLYPGVAKKETYPELLAQINEYCPLDNGYTLEMQTYDIYSKIGANEKTVIISYLLTTDEMDYNITVRYRVDDDAEGFTSFNVVSRADYEEYMKEQKK